MFHPESNPLAPKSSGPLKPEKELVEIWLGKEAAELMEDGKRETGDEEDLNFKKHELTEQEKRKLWEMKRPDEVTLRNIPTWKELPDTETFKKEFKFQSVRDPYSEGYLLDGYILGPAEVLPHAKIFDIADALAKTREKYSEHPDYLTTAEVLEAIDQAGYRPATLEELVAYGRDYWKPNADPTTLTKKERELLHSQASSVVGLGTVIEDVYESSYAMGLFWNHHDERELGGCPFDDNWSASAHFLVLRKSSPS